MRARDMNAKALLSSQGGSDKVFWTFGDFVIQNVEASLLKPKKFSHCLHTDSRTDKVQQ